MEINKKNEIDVTENNPIIEKNKVPQSEMKSGLQEKKNLKAEGTKAGSEGQRKQRPLRHVRCRLSVGCVSIRKRLTL